jgi:hypothetical protein
MEPFTFTTSPQLLKRSTSIDQAWVSEQKDGSISEHTILILVLSIGQGKIGYTTGAQPAPKNSERKGWALKDGHLQFAGNDLIACPNSIDGAWSIWASAGVSNPGGNKDCIGIAARIEKTSNPNGCVYTQ